MRTATLLLLACCLATATANLLELVKSWNQVTYKLSTGEIVETLDTLPLDVDVYFTGDTQKIFVTTPRFSLDTPVTLGTVDDDGYINAYPDDSWVNSDGTNCDAITSVFRVAIDKFERLWVVDTGKMLDDWLCSPQILAFDLKTNKLLYRHRPEKTSYISTSLFITPVVDFRDDTGDDTFIYVADVTGFGLLVVDVANDVSWRIEDSHFESEDAATLITIQDITFEIHDGLFGLAVGPMNDAQTDRTLYFHSLTSYSESYVPTSAIRDSSRFVDYQETGSSSFKTFEGKRKTQTAAEAMDTNGILYFGQMDPPAILAWDSSTEFNADNFHVVGQDNEALQFASGVKVVHNAAGEQELWTMTSSYQKFDAGTMSADETNFRIHRALVADILAQIASETSTSSSVSEDSSENDDDDSSNDDDDSSNDDDDSSNDDDDSSNDDDDSSNDDDDSSNDNDDSSNDDDDSSNDDDDSDD